MTDALPAETTPEDAAHAALLEAFADPLRLRILRRLVAAPCCVGELVDDCAALQPRVSRHLAVLRDAGLVTVEIRGKWRCYSIRRVGLVTAVLAALDAPPEEP